MGAAKSCSQLDEQLVWLGHRESICRCALGDLAARFLAGRGHHRLAFARLSDYARERLGVSAREFQSLAQVATALTTLPGVARAFAVGEISWTKVRLLIAVARRETEARWLACAQRANTRELRELVARENDPAGDRRRSDPAWSPVRSPVRSEDDDDKLDGEDAVRFRLTCTRGLRRIWHQTVEFARCVAGTQAPVWQAAEAIAAEGLSGPSAPLSTSQASIAVTAVAPPCPDARSGAAVGCAAGAAMGDALDATPTAETATGNAPDERGGLDATPTADAVLVGAFDERGVLDVAPTVAACVDGAPIPPATLPSDDTGDGETDPAALDARMRAILGELRCLDAEIGAVLRRVVTTRLHRRFGFASFAAYACDRLHVSAGKVRTLLALDRRLTRVPALRQAYGSGALSWSRAVVVLPVATVESAAAWVTRAGEVTVRRLEAEVAWALDRYDARPEEGVPGPPAADTDVRTAGVLGTNEVVPPVDDTVATMSLTAAMSQRAGGAATPCEVALRRSGSSPVERQMGARSMAPGDGAASGSDLGVFMADVEITFRAPRSIVVLLHEAMARFARPREPRWRAMARLLAHVRGEWQRQPRHRDPVFARDGWRCAVPACGSRGNLHDHHVRYRSRGGDNARDNRVTVCAWHHLRGIHAGRVRATGKAPEALTWELGSNRAGRTWLRFQGDRYLGGDGQRS